MTPGATAAQNQMTRTVARRLLPACVVAPALLWWILIFGVHRGWYQLETCFILFVYSVTVVFGVIVCINLKKISRMDAQRRRRRSNCGGRRRRRRRRIGLSRCFLRTSAMRFARR